MKRRIRNGLLMGAVILFALSAATAEEGTAAGRGVYAEEKIIRLDSGAERSADFVSADQDFTAGGKRLHLSMTGLKAENRDRMIECLEEHYEPGSFTPLKIIDEAFADADKWDSDADPLTDPYDAGHCWAASASNVLWISGWTKTPEKLTNPRTGKPFASEDDVFAYYNSKFSDLGHDFDRAIDWFFMGENFGSSDSPYADVYDPEPSDGLMKTFVSTLAQKKYDLTENPADIGQLARIPREAENAAIFEAMVGSLVNGELVISTHSVTVAGIITEPGAQSMSEKYRAILLIDSDNDALPTAAEKKRDREIFDPETEEDPDPQTQAERDAYRESVQAGRPNSYTVYGLSYRKDKKGKAYWAIDGYGTETTALYGINALAYPSRELIRALTETEGTADIQKNVDLTLDILFTTAESEAPDNPYAGEAEDARKESFASGKPVNLIYYLANRSYTDLNEEYPGGNRVTMEWTVTRDADGQTVAQGSCTRAFDIYSNTETGDVIELNSGKEAWESGDYTVTVAFNRDRAVREAYYSNNAEQQAHFSIRGKPAPEPKDLPETGDHAELPLWLGLILIGTVGLIGLKA